MAANEILRRIRKEKGFTAEKMATALGYNSKVSYYNIENEVTDTSLTTANKISIILGEPMEKLFPKFFAHKVHKTRTSKKYKAV